MLFCLSIDKKIILYNTNIHYSSLKIKISKKFLTMATIDWTEKFSVGVKSIDDQHKELFNLLNNFYAGFEKQTPQNKLLSLIKPLADYASMHFAIEEGYMKRCEYPELKEHQLEHQRFIDKVRDYETRHLNGKLIVTIEITNFIRDWLTNHIMVVDKKYSNFLIKKGVE